MRRRNIVIAAWGVVAVGLGTTLVAALPGRSVLHIRLDPLSAPRRTRALAALCAQLTATATRYPGTQLVLHYEVNEHPGTA